MSTHTLLDAPAIQTVLQHRLWDYALRRQQAVQADHETADLAGVLVQHFGYGMVETVRALLGPDGELVALPLLAAVDHAVAHLDPDWGTHAGSVHMTQALPQIPCSVPRDPPIRYTLRRQSIGLLVYI